MFDVFDGFFSFVGTLLAWFYGLTGDYSVSIILLTLLVMLAFTPLTLKGTRSMMAMQELQPEIKRLQVKHKSDRQKLNEEMMTLYRARGVNPLGGCLPSLVQIPVFMILYRVIIGITKIDEKTGNFQANNLPKDSEMFADLSSTNEMLSVGVNLARSANDVVRDNFVDSLPYLAMVGVTFFLAWFQQRQMRARRPEGATAPNPQMEMMMKIMPFMLPVFAFISPAALALYFIASSLYRIGQQAFIHKTMPPVVEAGGSLIDVPVVEEPETPSGKRSKGVRGVEAGSKGEDKGSQMSADQRAAARRARSKARRGTKSDRGSEDDVSDETGTETKGKPRPPKASEPPKPIQSKRTSGDARPNRRRKR